MGFKAIEANDLPYFKVDRGNEGYIDGKNFETKPFHFTGGDKSHKEFTDISNPLGILMGRHTTTTALAPGKKMPARYQVIAFVTSKSASLQRVSMK